MFCSVVRTVKAGRAPAGAPLAVGSWCYGRTAAQGGAAPKGPPMFLKRVFYASASILTLALAYHLGASTATAQAPSNPVVAVFMGSGDNLGVVTANGDVFGANTSSGP